MEVIQFAGAGRLYAVVGRALEAMVCDLQGLAAAIGSRGHSGLDSPGQSPFPRRGWPRQPLFYGLLRHYCTASPCRRIVGRVLEGKPYRETEVETEPGQSLRGKDESDTMLSPSLRLLRSRACRGAESYKTSSADIATQGRRAQGRLNVEHLQALAIQPQPRQTALCRHLP